MLLKRVFVSVVVFVVFLVSGRPAVALINQNFTPIDLLSEAELVLVMQLTPPDKKGNIAVKITQTLKGKTPKQAPVFALGGEDMNEHAKMIGRIVTGQRGGLALLVDGRNEHGDEASWLHVAGKWVDLFSEDKRTWDVDQINSEMQAVWAGSTDMLLKCFKYIQKDEDADVPVNAATMWGETVELGTVEGKVYQAIPVDLAGKGVFSLYIAAEKGDRLYSYNQAKETFEDVTVRRTLAGKTHCAAWADFNGDGLLDLAGWDGQYLTLRLQTKDGAFPADGIRLKLKTKQPCTGLAALDVGVKGRPGIVVSAGSACVLLVPGKGVSFTQKDLDPGKAETGKLGPAGACLVGDLDNDGMPDVLHPFERGSLFYKGMALGKFAAAVPCLISLGEGASGSCLGDWDGDGMLDVFCTAEDRCRLWHNQGKMVFPEMIGYSGEIPYISKPSGIGGQTCDINNDGRQDVLIVYSERSPHIFFNRGFRSFGHAHALDLEEKAFLPEASFGLQAGCVADFNGDGTHDMLVVLKGVEADKDRPAIKGGGLWLFPGEAMMDAAMCVRVALPLGGPYAGPVKVSASVKTRSFGAWNVTPGVNEAFFGIMDACKLTIKYQFPGGKEQTKILDVKDETVRLLIKPAAYAEDAGGTASTAPGRVSVRVIDQDNRRFDPAKMNVHVTIRTAYAVKSARKIEIDGRFQEKDWSGAAPITSLRTYASGGSGMRPLYMSHKPQTGPIRVAYDPTFVRALYDDENLYLSIVALVAPRKDKKPGSLEKDNSWGTFGKRNGMELCSASRP